MGKIGWREESGMAAFSSQEPFLSGLVTLKDNSRLATEPTNGSLRCRRTVPGWWRPTQFTLSLPHPVTQLIGSISRQQRPASCLLLLPVFARPPPSELWQAALLSHQVFFSHPHCSSLCSVIRQIASFVECLWTIMIVTKEKKINEGLIGPVNQLEEHGTPLTSHQ